MQSIRIVQNIFKEVEKFVKEKKLSFKIEEFASSQENWINDVANLFGKEKSNITVLVSDEWMKEAPENIASTFMKAVDSGMVRLGYWGKAEVEASGLPGVIVPTTRGDDVLIAMLRYFSGGITPGVNSVLPKGAKIFSEYVSAVSVIGRRVDQVIEFIEKTKEVSKRRSVSLRFALTAALIGAVEDSEKAGAARPPKIQVGVSEDLVAVSLRRSTNDCNLNVWNTPRFPHNIAVFSSDAFFTHVIMESKEIENLFLYGNEDRDLQVSASQIALGVFPVTNVQLKVFRESQGAKKMQTQKFGTFDEMPAPKEIKEKFIIEGKEEEDISNIVVSSTTEQIKEEKYVVKSGSAQAQKEGYKYKKSEAINGSENNQTTEITQTSAPPLVDQSIQSQQTAKEAKTHISHMEDQASQTVDKVLGTTENIQDEKIVVTGSDGTNTGKEEKTVVSGKENSIAQDVTYIIKAEDRNKDVKDMKLEELGEHLKAFRIEAATLRVKTETQDNLINNLKNKGTQLVKKLTDTVESERAAQKQIKIMEQQLKDANKHIADLKTFEEQMDAMKKQEFELTKKLSEATGRVRQLEREAKVRDKKSEAEIKAQKIKEEREARLQEVREQQETKAKELKQQQEERAKEREAEREVKAQKIKEEREAKIKEIEAAKEAKLKAREVAKGADK